MPKRFPVLYSIIFCSVAAALFAEPQSLPQKLSESGIVFRLEDHRREMTEAEFESRMTSNPDGSIDLNLAFLTIRDLSVVTNQPLSGLGASYTAVESLKPLAGLPLKWLEFAETKVTDLSPLAGMPLTKLNAAETMVSDLSPLQGMALTKLNLCHANVFDLSPVKGMPLEIMDIDHNQGITDISPLHGMPLMYLKMENIPVDDLSPLEGCPIKSLLIRGTRVKDLSPILGLPLTNLEFTEANITNGLSGLRSVKSLQTINGVGVDEFWEMLEMDKALAAFASKHTPDSELAITTQKHIDAMHGLTRFEEWPDCIANTPPWSTSEQIIHSNLLAFSSVGEYLGLKVKKKRIANSDTDWSNTIAVSSKSRKVLYVDPLLLSKPNKPVDESAFDVNDYLQELPRLHLADGYVLDYLYLGVGPGTPLLYGRKADAPRIHSHQLFHYLVRGRELDQDAYQPYLEILRTDGTEEGFLQLALFHHLCEQFYGGYQLGPLIASHASMAAFLSDTDNFMRMKGNKRYPLPFAIQEKAFAIDPTPRIDLGKTTVTLSLIGFSNWKGFYHLKRSYRRDAPHLLQKEKMKILVPYNCRIIY